MDISIPKTKKLTICAALFLAAFLCACAPEKEAETVAEETAAPENRTVTEEVFPTAAPEGTAVPEQTSFTLLCRTENGTPVPGTKVDVCNGSFCRNFTAGEDGRITYYGMPCESCDITPARAPEGYVFVSDRALIADGPGLKFEFILKEK